MLITLRLPRSSALRLNLAVDDVERQEVAATLTAVELAGRLTLATGKAISPEAVVRYSVAWQAATATLHGLVKKHGKVGLVEMLRETCGHRALWVPEDNESAVEWLACLLEVYFLRSAPAAKPSPEDGQLVTEQQAGQMLADLCERSFPLAYHLWAQAEA
jgi:hypothetical protein